MALNNLTSFSIQVDKVRFAPTMIKKLDRILFDQVNDRMTKYLTGLKSRLKKRIDDVESVSYYIPFRGGRHPVSRVGHTPNTMTGRLAKSITFDKGKRAKGKVFAKFNFYMDPQKTKVKGGYYAEILENKKKHNRPYFRTVVLSNKEDRIRKRIAEDASHAIKAEMENQIMYEREGVY